MMGNLVIITGVKMKKFILLIFIVSCLFAVKTVPRAKKNDDHKTSEVITEIVTEEKEKTQITHKAKKEKKKDRFQDADSNSVNDQREDDLQKIKWLKTKFKDLKDLFKKKTPDKTKESSDKKSKPQKNKSR